MGHAALFLSFDGDVVIMDIGLEENILDASQILLTKNLRHLVHRDIDKAKETVTLIFDSHNNGLVLGVIEVFSKTNNPHIIANRDLAHTTVVDNALPQALHNLGVGNFDLKALNVWMNVNHTLKDANVIVFGISTNKLLLRANVPVLHQIFAVVLGSLLVLPVHDVLCLDDVKERTRKAEHQRVLGNSQTDFVHRVNIVGMQRVLVKRTTKGLSTPSGSNVVEQLVFHRGYYTRSRGFCQVKNESFLKKFLNISRMNFVEFYHQFINEGFINHGTVKYRAMAETNRVFRKLLQSVKDVSKLGYFENVRHNVFNKVEFARSVADTYVDTEEIVEYFDKEIIPTIEAVFTSLESGTPSTKNLFYWYVMFCMSYSGVTLKDGQFLTLVKNKASDVLFLSQEDRRKFINGDMDVISKGLPLGGVEMAIYKESPHYGAFYPDSNEVQFSLPFLRYTNRPKKEILDIPSYAVSRLYPAYNLYERITNPKYFNDFVNEIEQRFKPILVHELTHAWQKKRRFKNPNRTYIGNSHEIFECLPIEQSPHKKEKLAYIISDDEEESRRGDAQMRYKHKDGNYLDCYSASDTFIATSYSTLRKAWLIPFNHFPNSVIRKMFIMYKYFVLLPQDPTFVDDLEKNTVRTRSGVKYKGSYAHYMKDYQSFKAGDFVFKPEELKHTMRNFLYASHAIARAIDNLLSKGESISSLRKLHDKYICEEHSDSGIVDFYLRTYGSRDTEFMVELRELLRQIRKGES